MAIRIEVRLFMYPSLVPPTIFAVPVVTVFVRHSKTCPSRSQGEFYKRCRCAKHLRWMQDRAASNGSSCKREQKRQSAKTRSWTVAEEAKRRVEHQFAAGLHHASALPEPQLRPKTLREVRDLFLSSKRSQGFESDVLRKYERESERFCLFMEQRSKHLPADVTLEDLTVFRSDWAAQYPSSMTRAKVQERLRSFLRYCYEAGFMERVPRLSPIKVDVPPTMPLSELEYQGLLKAVATEFPHPKRERVHALVQLMRFSGLAIRDAVTLERAELHDDESRGLYRVVTSRQKTGTHVSVPIPPQVAEEVRAAMQYNRCDRYAFWNTGTGKPSTAVTNWQHDLRQAFRAAGMPEGHPHQLRDTFAVSLLQKGVPLEEVSKLLGHESIKTTEKYYAKWVKERQDRLDSLVIATWT